jgi:hypothetical protein
MYLFAHFVIRPSKNNKLHSLIQGKFLSLLAQVDSFLITSTLHSTDIYSGMRRSCTVRMHAERKSFQPEISSVYFSAAALQQIKHQHLEAAIT